MIADGLVVIGVICIVAAAWWIHPAAGLSVLGCVLVGFGVYLVRRSEP